MLVLTPPTDLSRITHPGIRQLVTVRFQQLAERATTATTVPMVTPCEFIVVGGGDAVSDIEQAAGYPILTGLFDDLPYTDPDFQPCSEILEEHHHEQYTFYEMVFIGNDDGAATCVLIPDTEDIDADLLAMCRAFSTPAIDPAVSTP